MADCNTFKSEYEAEVSKVTATTPTAAEVATAITDLRAESNGVSELNAAPEESGMGLGAIIGIVVGVLALVAIVAVVVVTQKNKKAQALPAQKTGICEGASNDAAAVVEVSDTNNPMGAAGDYADEM
jgi:hypothetical protein